MNVPWDTQQCEWLQAMGYRVWRLAGAESPPPAAPEDAAPATAGPVPAAAAPKPPPPSGPVAEPDAPAGGRPPPMPTGAERRLYRALLRATGQRTTRAAEALLAQLQFDLPAMRGDPAAKRALWPRLRALRKASERR